MCKIYDVSEAQDERLKLILLSSCSYYHDDNLLASINFFLPSSFLKTTLWHLISVVASLSLAKALWIRTTGCCHLLKWNLKLDLPSASTLSLSHSPETPVGEASSSVCQWCHPRGPWCARSRCVWAWKDEREHCRRKESPPPPVARSSPATAEPRLRIRQSNHYWINVCLKLQATGAQVRFCGDLICFITNSGHFRLYLRVK